MKKQTVLFIILFILTGTVSAQQNVKAIKIGEVVPDIFFNEMWNFKQQDTARLSDFKGKAIILDFWATWCAPCVAAIPDLQQMQNKYYKDLQVITISNEKKEVIKKFFTNTKYQDINLVAVTGANHLLKLYFPRKYIPHQIWIDKNGVLRAITDGKEINTVNIEKLINNEPLDLPVKSDFAVADAKMPQPVNKPQLSVELQKMIDGEDNLSVTSYSVFAGYVKGRPNSITAGPKQTPEYKDKHKKVSAWNVSAIVLYKAAFGYPIYGRLFPSARIVSEIRDTVKYKQLTRKNKPTDTTLVSYGLSITHPDQKLLYKRMQDDLAVHFGVRGTIEKRSMGVYVLICTDPSKLITGNGTSSAEETLLYYKAINKPIAHFISILREYNEVGGLDVKRKIIIEDGTGLAQNIDLNIVAKLNDLPALTAELRKNGLDLIEADREIEVLVLSDNSVMAVQ